jgi:hypothetical protein
MALGKVDNTSAPSSASDSLQYIYNGSTWVEMRADADGNTKVNILEYVYQGKKVNAGYNYYAFKQHGSGRYRILKKSIADSSDVSWATGASGFVADWAVYTTLTYTVIPSTI